MSGLDLDLESISLRFWFDIKSDYKWDVGISNFGTRLDWIRVGFPFDSGGYGSIP